MIIFATSGPPRKISDDDSKQIELFVACSPNPVDLNILNITNMKIISFSIFNNIANKNITKSFVTLKYMPSNPYLISESFVSV